MVKLLPEQFVPEHRALLLANPGPDTNTIEQLLTDAGIPSHRCESVAALCEEIDRGVGVVLISEEWLLPNLDQVVACIRRQPVWSDLSAIVLTRAGSEGARLDKALERAGNFTLLEQPVRDGTFLALVRASLRARVRQYEVRDHILDRAGLDQDLRRSREAFFNLVDAAPFGVYLVDSNLCIHSVNEGAQAAFANVRPLIGRPFEEAMRILWPESFALEAMKWFKHVLATGESYVAPTLIEERADVGVTQAYEWELHRVSLPDATFGVVCYFYESTKLRQAEWSMREWKRRSEASLLAGEVGTYYWDIVGDRITGDRNFLAMFGIHTEVHEPAPLASFMGIVHPDDVERVQNAMRATLESDVPYNPEYRITLPDGDRWIIARGMVERDAEGKARAWAGVVVDITERKQAEDERRASHEGERVARSEAERASRMKDEFLATISHELRTPLAAILGWTQVLKLRYSADPEIDKGLSAIDRNARAQTLIIEDLLDMSAIISGKTRLDVQWIELGSVLSAAIDTVRPAADAKGIRLSIDMPDDVGTICGDANRLHQVFWNLLSNAVKFTSRDQDVVVRVRRNDSRVEVSVCDTGKGIEPDFVPHVFDRFRQADASTTRQHGGLGLGLAIVKQLVEMHGGTVNVFSEGLGKGATFTVEFPITLVQTEARTKQPRAAPPASPLRPADRWDDVAGVRLLVVDDEPDARALVARLLEDREAVVVTAGSAAEALELVRTLPLDVIVSDIGMPGEDGYALMRKVRALAPEDGGSIGAIALTAYARAEDQASALRAGFQLHLIKPVDPAKLMASVASVAAVVRRGREEAVGAV